MDILTLLPELDKFPGAIKMFIRWNLYWIIFGGGFLYATIDLQFSYWQIFVYAFIGAIVLTLFYPYYWKRYGERRKNEYLIKQNQMHFDFQEVREKMKRMLDVCYITPNQTKELLNAGKEVQESFIAFRKKYCPDENEK